MLLLLLLLLLILLLLLLLLELLLLLVLLTLRWELKTAKVCFILLVQGSLQGDNFSSWLGCLPVSFLPS